MEINPKPTKSLTFIIMKDEDPSFILDPKNPNSNGFWNIGFPRSYCSINNIIYKGYLKYVPKSNPNKLKQCLLCLTDGELFYFKSNNENCIKSIDLIHNFCRFEIGNERHKRQKVEFVCENIINLEEWSTYLRKYCINSKFLDNYEVFEQIGKGGYSNVYKCQSIKNKKYYAVKILDCSTYKSKTKARMMISNEIKAMRIARNCDQIINLHEVYEDNLRVYIIMELVDGKKLLDHIRKNGLLSEYETALILKSVLLALIELKKHGVVHRDIKCENIMIKQNSKGTLDVKLIDFGLAYLKGQENLIRKCGTPGYMAPEIFNGECYDHKIDVYALGAVLFLAFSGTPAFRGLTHDEVINKNKIGHIKFYKKIWMGITESARDLVYKMMQPNPSDRILMEEIIFHPWLSSQLSRQAIRELKDSLALIDTRSEFHIPEERTICNIPISEYSPNMDFSTFSCDVPVQSGKFSYALKWETTIGSFYKGHSLKSINGEYFQSYDFKALNANKSFYTENFSPTNSKKRELDLAASDSFHKQRMNKMDSIKTFKLETGCFRTNSILPIKSKISDEIEENDTLSSRLNIFSSPNKKKFIDISKSKKPIINLENCGYPECCYFNKY